MLIKTADDRTKRLRLLEDLQQSTRLDHRQKEWLTRELSNTRKGMGGERDAAHYIDNHYRDSKNHMVIHDLRIQVDGEVAQIDHLIVGRGFIFYLLETKTFGGNLHINEYGEFSVQYPGERVFGIPSPMEQSRRHANVLTKLLDVLGIAGRLSSKPRYEHLVLVHPKAVIQRPDPTKLDTSSVIKADQFASWHQNFVGNKLGVAETMTLLADLRSADTVKDWAEKIARQHRSADPLQLPDFMRPAARPIGTSGGAADVQVAAQPTVHQDKKRLVCAECRQKISYAEGKFCWSNERRFGGLQYCREHQMARK